MTPRAGAPPHPPPARPDLWSLDPTVLHLNHGSYGAVPRRTQQVAAALRSEAETNPMAWFRGLPVRVRTSRRVLAGYLGVDPDGFALVRNASAGITTALATVPIPAGGRIVLTDHGYGAVRYVAERFARLRGAEVVTVALPLTPTDDEVVAAVADALDERTAVVVVDHITSDTALVLPVARLAAVCRPAGVPMVVDGAHAPALIDAPVPDGVDFWVGNFHKWPCAPRGTAGLVVADCWRSRTLPRVVSWTEYAADLPTRFDWQATDDYVAWLAAPTSLQVLADLDWPRRRAELADLLTDAADLIANAVGTAVPRPVAPAPTMRLVELPLRGIDRDGREAFKTRVARQAGAEVTLTAHGDRTFLRLSAHAYNADRDYALLAARLPALL